jgi:hypothetical protein
MKYCQDYNIEKNVQDGKLGESSKIKNNAKNIVLRFRNNIKKI